MSRDLAALRHFDELAAVYGWHDLDSPNGNREQWSKWHAVRREIALLAESTPAAPDEEGLDAAWAAAEASLGEYWRVRSLVEVKDGWEAVATDGNRIAHVAGPTPLAALRALAPQDKA